MPNLYNPGLVQNLKPTFQGRYEAQFAWGNAVSFYLSLPGLRGFWPGGTFDYQAGSNVGVNDLSGNALNLSKTSSPYPEVRADGTILPAYMYFAGNNAQDFRVSSRSEYQITGTEAGINVPGLTLGCWVNMNSGTMNIEGIMGCGIASTNTRAYALYWDASYFPTCQISSAGTAWNNVLAGSDALVAETWYFHAMRYTPSTELKLWVNDASFTDTTSVPASLNTTANPFAVGGIGENVINMKGKVCYAFLCAAAVPDLHIELLYELTRPMFHS